MFQKLRTLQNLKVELWLTEVSKQHKLKKEGVNYGESDFNDSVRFCHWAIYILSWDYSSFVVDVNLKLLVRFYAVKSVASCVQCV